MNRRNFIAAACAGAVTSAGMAAEYRALGQTLSDPVHEEKYRYATFIDSSGVYEGADSRRRWFEWLHAKKENQIKGRLAWEGKDNTLCQDYKDAAEITLRCIEDVSRLRRLLD